MTLSPDPDELRLAGEFPAATRARWRELVTGVLDRMGVRPEDQQAPEQALASTTYDGITIAPLYTADDLGDIDGRVGLPGLPPFVRGSRPHGSAATGWDVRARHADPDPAATNEAALADLEHGVSSLWLLAGSGGVPVGELGTALDGVLLDLAPVVLDAGADYVAAADALLALHSEKDVPASELRCTLGADPIGLRARTGARADPAEAAALAARHAERYPCLRTIVVDATPYHDAGGSDAQELGCSIATGVGYLRALTEAGLPVDAAFTQLEFRYAVNADQFLGIAKLRAARRLWDRVGTECGAGAEARAQRQHAVTSSAMMTERDPWVNMLRTTVACFAAGVGGADAVTVQPFDSRLGIPDAFARRIARNSQAILLEESTLAGVIDPAGGSWYVEWLTDALARTAWSVFTEIESAGGMVSALDAGLVAERISATWFRRRDNIATRVDPITGVSEFPNLAERTLTRKRYPCSTLAGGGLEQVHYGQDFERLRTRADAHAALHGDRPKVFLATLGPVAKHTARATFAANLFQAGGIETQEAGATEAVDDVVGRFRDSGTSVACVCGNDSAYTEWLGKVAPALAEAGATKVLLAGGPSEDVPSDVDSFLFVGCDALVVLTDTLEVLGVK